MLDAKLKARLEREITRLAIKHIYENPRQRLIRAYIRYWEMTNKKRLSEFDEDMTKLRAAARDQFSNWKLQSSDFRKFLKIPKTLFEQLEELLKIYEDNIEIREEGRLCGTEKELNWFWKNFKRYCVAEKI